MTRNKLLFNAWLVIGTASIILMVLSIIANAPELVLLNVTILAVSIIFALLNYRSQP